jgi:hypothetical protein
MSYITKFTICTFLQSFFLITIQKYGSELESAENIFSNLPEEDDSVVVRFVAVVDCHFLQLKHVHGGGPTYQDLHLQGTVSRELI